MRLKDLPGHPQVGMCDRPPGSSQTSNPDPIYSDPTFSQIISIIENSHEIDPLVQMFVHDSETHENQYAPDKSYVQLSPISLTQSSHMSDTSQSQDIPVSQDYVPNQEYYQTLDAELLGLPKELYVNKLINLTHSNDSAITWYRGVLLSRARSVKGCPLGELITRKSTVNSSSSEKYARDCYIIQDFISGNTVGIDDIFKSDQTKSKQKAGSENLSTNSSLIDLRVSLQSALNRLTELENREKNNLKEIEALKRSNKKLSSDIQESNQKLETLQSNYDRKCAQLDANFKLCKQKSNCIGEFDYNEYITNVERLKSETTRQGKLITNLQKSVSDIKIKGQQSYAKVTQGEPLLISDVNTAKSGSKCSNYTQSSSASIPNGNIDPDSFNCEKRTVSRNHVDSESDKESTEHSITHDRSQEFETEKVPTTTFSNNGIAVPLTEPTFQIPVRVHGETAVTEKSANGNFFSGAKRRTKTSRFYLSGIDSKSTREGIIQFLEHKNVRVTYLRIFSQREHQRFVSAKINVPDECAERVKESDFWPTGVSCREWLSDRDWKQKLYDDYEYDDRTSYKTQS